MTMVNSGLKGLRLDMAPYKFILSLLLFLLFRQNLIQYNHDNQWCYKLDYLARRRQGHRWFAYINPSRQVGVGVYKAQSSTHCHRHNTLDPCNKQGTIQLKMK